MIVAGNCRGVGRAEGRREEGIIGQIAVDIGRNLVHGSDSVENAEQEINLFFAPEEILSYKRSAEGWITES